MLTLRFWSQKLFPTVEVSKEAQHASNGVQMQVAEALLIACTIFWPLVSVLFSASK